MTRIMDTSTVIRRGTSYVCETGKGHLARAASKTGSVRVALRTVCLRIATSKDTTSKSEA